MLYIAPFAVDGESLGIGKYEFAKLSSRWLENCDAFIQAVGPVGRESWGGQLAGFETKLTAARGAGLGSFYSNGNLALSCLLASGDDQHADQEVIKMFVDSARRIDVVRLASESSEPFVALPQLKERPLFAVVPWPQTGVSDDDFDALRELSTHFAAAFFKLSALRATAVGW